MLRYVPAVLLSAAAALALASSTAAQDDYTIFGTGCPGPSGIPPAIGITGLPVAGQQFSIDLSAAPSSAPAVLLFGVSDRFWNGQPLPFHLGVIGVPGCWLLVSNDITLTTLTDPAGFAQMPIPLPPLPSSVGVMRGVGSQPMLAPSASLDVSSAWGWQGSGLPGSGAAGGTFTPRPTATVAVTSFLPGPLGFSTALADDPFGNGGIYPIGRHIHIEIHWQRRNGKWVDIVIDIDLRLAAPGPVVAAELGPMLQSATDQTIGQGVLAVSTQGLELTVSRRPPTRPCGALPAT